ncbi:MAG: alpha/beta hydrolase, partial [Pseudomonadota bacterium]
RHMENLDKSRATIPAIFFLSDADTVVEPEAIRDAAAAWGAPSEVVTLTMGPSDDASSHVIAGDILSPGQNEAVIARLIQWAQAL